MIIDGFALAVITTAAFMLLYNKFPDNVRGFMNRHSLATDIVACITTYAFLGGTLTALFAGAFVGIFVSIMLYVANNQDEFMYLFDIRNWIGAQLEEIKVGLNNLGTSYRNSKMQSNPAVN